MNFLSFISCAVWVLSVFPVWGQKPFVYKGTIHHISMFSSQYVDARAIDIWLPQNYDKTKKYQVVYMHDGQMLFDSTNTWNHQEWCVDETIERLLYNHKIKPSIVVGISHTEKRYMEYFPQKVYDALSDSIQKSILSQLHTQHPSSEPTLNPLSDKYLQFLVYELKPFIDSTYSTYTDVSHTFVMGSSMGGLISLYALCEYPQIFGGAACLSTHWVGTFQANKDIPHAFITYLQHHLPPVSLQHKIYFDYGDQTLDSLYSPFQKQVDELMQSFSYPTSQWQTYFFAGATHSEKSWAARLEFPFIFLLR